MQFLKSTDFFFHPQEHKKFFKSTFRILREATLWYHSEKYQYPKDYYTSSWTSLCTWNSKQLFLARTHISKETSQKSEDLN